jgi:hypothetical protein
MKYKIPTIAAIAAITLVGPASAVTLLFSDNFNDDPNDQASSFNANLASTQSGTLANTTYSVLGTGFAAQHSNSSEMLVANFSSVNVGRVSLNNNFAIQANALNQALVFSFELGDVSGFAETSDWGGFTVGGSQNPFVNAGGGAAILFRQNGGIQAFNAGTGVINTGAWSAGDIVTVTLSGAGGVGSAFNGNGSVVNYNVGGTDLGSITLAQQTNAYLTFGIVGPNDGNTSVFKIDNLTVSAVPEPSAALLGGLGALALLRRRRA